MNFLLKILSSLLLCSGPALAGGVTKVSLTKFGSGVPPINQTLAKSDPEMGQVIKYFEGLPFDGTPGARCHFPVYKIEIFEGDKVVASATICWQCHNVQFLVPAEKGLQGFDGKSADVQAFQKLLDGIFIKSQAKPIL